MELAHDYDLDSLKLIKPLGQQFQFHVTPRFVWRYEQSRYEAYTAQLLAKFCERASIFVDVGAHYGFFSLIAATRNPKLRVIAAEPARENFEILTRNAELNGLKNVEPLNVAVSDREGKRPFHISSASDNCGFYVHPVTPTLRSDQVEVATIDGLLASAKPGPIVFKIDVEGNEFAVLDGMKRTLKRFPDIALFVEFNPEMIKVSGRKPGELLQRLESLGFSVFLLDDEKQRHYRVSSDTDWTAFCKPEGYANLVCLPCARALNVVFVSHLSGLGGAERSLLELVDEWITDQWILATVLCPGDGPLIKAMTAIGAAVVTAPFEWWCQAEQIPADVNLRMARSANAIIQRLPLFRDIDPDLVWTQSIVVPWGAAVAALLHKPHIWSICEWGERDHQLKFYIPFSKILKIVDASSNFIFTVSPEMIRELFPQLDSRRADFFYPYVDIPTRKDIKSADAAWTMTDVTRIAAFGTLQAGKGQEDLISAVGTLASRGRRIELLLAGDAIPSYHKRLQLLAKRLGISKHVVFTGFIDNPYPTMATADIVVSCARQEAFGLSLVEAMLLERAVVYAGAGGPLEYMADGKTGLSYPPGDAAQLAEQLDRLIAHPTQRKKLGQQARAQAKVLFSRASYGDKALKRALELRGQSPRVLSALGEGARPIFETVESLASLVGTGTDESNLLLQSVRSELDAARSRATELERAVEVWSNETKGLQHGVQVWSKQAHDLEADRAALNRQLSEQQVLFKEKSEEFDRELYARKTEIEMLTNKISGLEHAVHAGAKQVSDLEAGRVIFKREFVEQQVLFQKSCEELSRIYRSRSWRLTSPMRAIRRYFAELPARALHCGRRLYKIAPLPRAIKGLIKSALFAAVPALARRVMPAYPQHDMPAGISARPSDVLTEGAAPVPICAIPLQIVPPARVIAFYLPQFHPIPENDKFWGKGFTEWTNVTRGKSQFEGHYQPRVPGELGYYDLRRVEVQRRQIELAKLYGIGGFCIYIYWFNGRLLLEKPLEQYLQNPDLDLPFCLCWANENWTRAWDGQASDILVEQHHSGEDDIAFIQHLAKYLEDPRYIRVDGKPLVIVYRPGLLPNARKTAERWRSWYQKRGLGEIYLAYVQSFDSVDPCQFGFDAAIEFPPNNMGCPLYWGELNLQNPLYSGKVFDWKFFVKRSENYKTPKYVLFRGVNPSWDNEARRPGRGTVMVGSSPELYRRWLENALRDTVTRFDEPSKRLVFVNAWNEWAEGAYLEPDNRYGFAYLQATRNAIEHVALEQRSNRAAARSQSGIIVIGHDAHPHGAQFLALNIIRELRQAMGLDAECLLLCGGSLTSDYKAIGPTHELNGCGPDSAEALRLINSLKLRGFHTALCNTTVTGHFAPLLKSLGFRVVSLVHELPQVLANYEGVGLKNQAESIAAASDTIVFPGEFVADGFRNFGAFSWTKAAYLTQGLYKRNRFRTAAEVAGARNELREQLGLATDTRIVLSVAFADHRKGIDLFIDIGERLAADMPNTAFVWVGNFDDQIKNEITDRIARSAYAKNFIFPGFISDTDTFYAGADLYALTSREDPFPSVILESLDVGVPVVAFEGVGAFENTVRTNDVGRMVAPFDTEAFAQELKNLLRDETLRIALGRAGANLIKHDFSFRKYVYDLLAIANISVKRVSIVVPNYNYCCYLEARLRSVGDQTIAPYEIIVLDDVSTDNSRKWLDKYLERICPIAESFYNERNSGSVFIQWLSGVRRARGDYVWIAEADDIAEPEFLAEVLAKFDNPDVVLSFCESKQIDSDGNILCDNYLDYVKDISPTKWTGSYINDGVDEIVSTLSIKNTIPNVSAVVFKRDILLKVLESKIDEIVKFRVAGDWVTYIEVLRNGEIAFSPRALNLHRRHTSGVTLSSFNASQLKEIMSVQKNVRDAFDLPDAIIELAEAYSQKLFEQFGLNSPDVSSIRQDSEPSKLL